MKVNLTKILPDLNAIIAYADAVSVGAKSGCIVHVVRQEPQWPLIYFANDMNTVYGKYVHRGGIEECDVAFRSHLFPDVKKGMLKMESRREGVRFLWKKKGIDKSVVIPRESEIQSTIEKAFERDWEWDNHVGVTERIFAAFEGDIGVAKLFARKRDIRIVQFKPTGEESFENVYNFKTTARGWGAIEHNGVVEEKSVTIKTMDFTRLSLLTGNEDFMISVNGEEKPLCISIQMNDGVLRLLLSHMKYRL